MVAQGSFGNRERFQPEQKAETQERQRITNEFIGKIEALTQRNSASVGAEAGKLFVTMLEKTNLGFVRVADMVKDAFAAAGKKQNGEMFISGFATEYAAAKAFHDLDVPIYHPTKAEDMKAKVDWWVDLEEEGQEIAVQVKSIPLKEGITATLYPLKDIQEVKRVLGSVIIPENLDLGRNISRGEAEARAEEYRTQIEKSLSELLAVKNFSTEDGEPRTIMPALMLLASPGSEGTQINMITGEPSQDMKDAIVDSIYDDALWSRKVLAAA